LKRTTRTKLGEVERVYRILRDWLMTAKLAPGEFLPKSVWQSVAVQAVLRCVKRVPG